MEEYKKSPHILAASSNLVGFCFVVLTSIKILNLSAKTLIDNITIFSFLAFMISCIFSFLSIRTTKQHGIILETVAEYTFILGLFLVMATAILLAFNLIN
jgi:hypothetical protein